jgi:hypothetical protein
MNLAHICSLEQLPKMVMELGEAANAIKMSSENFSSNKAP